MFILWQKGELLPQPVSCMHTSLSLQQAEAVQMFMPENKIFATHAVELLKSEKNVLTTCPDETRKICFVFSNCVVGRWAKGSRPMKIAAFSMISTAPCQFRICHVTSDQFKMGGMLSMEVALEW